MTNKMLGSRPIRRQLVDVLSCAYYAKTSNVPPPGTPVTVRLDLNRLCVDVRHGDHLGFLTECDFMIVEIRERQLGYSGTVITSRRALEYPVIVVELSGRQVQL